MDNGQSIVNVQASPTTRVVSIYIFEKCKFEEASLVFKSSKLLSMFIEKNHMCRMTENSGACDSFDFDGISNLVGSDDIVNNEDVVNSGFEIIKFSRDDKIIGFISLMGNNKILTAITFRENYTFFLSDHYKLIENNKIEEGFFLSSTNDSLDHFGYDFAKCGEGVFKTTEGNQIHSSYTNEEAKKMLKRKINVELREN